MKVVPGCEYGSFNTFYFSFWISVNYFILSSSFNGYILLLKQSYSQIRNTCIFLSVLLPNSLKKQSYRHEYSWNGFEYIAQKLFVQWFN